MIKIFIPYNNENCHFREQSFQRIYKLYESYGYEPIILNSDPFSRSAARNAVFLFDLDINESVFFSDADILIPKNQIEEAIQTSYQTGEMVLAYDKLVKLAPGENEIINSKTKIINGQISGGFAIPISLLKSTGGWDERFITWGCEDRIFYYLAAYLKGKQTCQRIPGKAYHFFHPKDLDANSKTLKNNFLHKRYLQAFGICPNKLIPIRKPEKKKVRALIKEQSIFPEYKKSIVNFEEKSILAYRKNRKVLRVIEGSNLHKRVQVAKEYTEIEQPKVCISIPCYNCDKTLRRSVISVLSQVYTNFELILISDNDPTCFDSISDIIDHRIKKIYLKENIGRYAIDHMVVNELTNCKYWATIDSDDFVSNNWLHMMVDNLGKNDVLFTYLKSLERNKSKLLRAKEFMKSEELKWYAHMGGALWSTNFIKVNQLTSIEYRIAWDTMMVSKAMLLGKYSVINLPLYTREVREDSLTQSKSTGFGSPERRRVKGELQRKWKSFFNEVTACLS